MFHGSPESGSDLSEVTGLHKAQTPSPGPFKGFVRLPEKSGCPHRPSADIVISGE